MNYTPKVILLQPLKLRHENIKLENADSNSTYCEQISKYNSRNSANQGRGDRDPNKQVAQTSKLKMDTDEIHEDTKEHQRVVRAPQRRKTLCTRRGRTKQHKRQGCHMYSSHCEPLESCIFTGLALKTSPQMGNSGTQLLVSFIHLEKAGILQ